MEGPLLDPGGGFTVLVILGHYKKLSFLGDSTVTTNMRSEEPDFQVLHIHARLLSIIRKNLG